MRCARLLPVLALIGASGITCSESEGTSGTVVPPPTPTPPCTLEPVELPTCEGCPTVDATRFVCTVERFGDKVAGLSDGSFYGTLIADVTDTWAVFRTGEHELVVETAPRGLNLEPVQNAEVPTFYLRDDADLPVRTRDPFLRDLEAITDHPEPESSWVRSAELRDGVETAVYVSHGDGIDPALLIRELDGTAPRWTEFESEDFEPSAALSWAPDGRAFMARKVDLAAVIGPLDDLSEVSLSEELETGWWGNWRLAMGPDGRVALGLPDRDTPSVLLVEGEDAPVRTVMLKEGGWVEDPPCADEYPCQGTCKRTVRQIEDEVALYFDQEGLLIVSLDDTTSFTVSRKYVEDGDGCFDDEVSDAVDGIELVGQRIALGTTESVEVFRLPLAPVSGLGAHFAVAGKKLGIIVPGSHSFGDAPGAPHFFEVDVSGLLVD